MSREGLVHGLWFMVDGSWFMVGELVVGGRLMVDREGEIDSVAGLG